MGRKTESVHLFLIIAVMYSLTFSCSTTMSFLLRLTQALAFITILLCVMMKECVYTSQSVWAAECQLQSPRNMGNACCHTPRRSFLRAQTHTKASARAPVEVFKPCQHPGQPDLTVPAPVISYNRTCINILSWSQAHLCDDFRRISAAYLWVRNYFFFSSKQLEPYFF